MMKRNTTLLLPLHQCQNIDKPIFRFISPLFQLNAYPINLNQSLDKITNNLRFIHQPHKKYFDRILVITSSQQSNARRNTFINSKREHLIKYFNEFGRSSMLYTIYLNQINQFIPQKYLIDQIDLFIKNKSQKILKLKADQRDSNRIAYFKKNFVDQFNIEEWHNFMKKSFPRHSTVNRYLLESSYFNIQISNIYMIKFGRNPELMYLDLKDLDAYLAKFNFIRYFYQLFFNNGDIAQKHCQRLIKYLKFRTDQTQQYLLMLIRSVNWERFLIYIQDYCIIYQSLISKQTKGNENQPQTKTNNQNSVQK